MNSKILRYGNRVGRSSVRIMAFSNGDAYLVRVWRGKMRFVKRLNRKLSRE